MLAERREKSKLKSQNYRQGAPGKYTTRIMQGSQETGWARFCFLLLNFYLCSYHAWFNAPP